MLNDYGEKLYEVDEEFGAPIQALVPIEKDHQHFVLECDLVTTLTTKRLLGRPLKEYYSEFHTSVDQLKVLAPGREDAVPKQSENFAKSVARNKDILKDDLEK
ncbi:hypothetical protein HAX54_006904, partial [Datura stramonium]|nr:hypothetical protein [Datura stramonium]